MKKQIQYVFLAIISLSLVFGACKKKNEDDSDTSVSQNHNAIESEMDAVSQQMDAAAANAGMGKTGPAITLDTISVPHKMTLDFGTSTVCSDGKIRSGKIIVTWTGRYRETGAIKTVSFENYVSDGNAVDNASTKTVQNMGKNSQNQTYFNITANIIVTLGSNGNTVEWSSTRVRTWIAGESTATRSDDVYTLTGTTSGVNRKGISYTSTITTPLTIDLSCNMRKITAGVIELKPQGKLTRIIDFGNGACDGTVTVTIGNRTYTITKV